MYSIQTTASAGNPVAWHAAEHKTWGRLIDGKMKASQFLLPLNPSTVSLFCKERWLPYYALTDKLENNTINCQWDLKLAIWVCLCFLCKSRFSSPPLLPHSGVGMCGYLESVKMWNELSCTNRNGCYWVVCCSLLRSNNKIRSKSISEWGGRGRFRMKTANMVNPLIIILGLHSGWIILLQIFLSWLMRKWFESSMWFLLNILHIKLMCFTSSEWTLPHASTLTHKTVSNRPYSPAWWFRFW